MSLVEFVVAVHRQLVGHRLPHAFGGALALAYVAEPRGTVDVDVNVFVSLDEVDAILGALASLDLQPESPREKWVPVAGVRLRSAAHPFPLDVFPSLDDAYDEIEDRCVARPFGPEGVELPFLSAEDLALFKLSFGRDKDWVDLRAIARARPDLDVDYIERQLVVLRGPTMNVRVARLRRLLRG